MSRRHLSLSPYIYICVANIIINDRMQADMRARTFSNRDGFIIQNVFTLCGGGGGGLLDHNLDPIYILQFIHSAN